eukprot:scaffold45125_cov65-Phaeocystis_antarctica.AAC.1
MRGRKGTQWSNLCACGGGASRAAILSSVPLYLDVCSFLGCVSIPPNLAVGARAGRRGVVSGRPCRRLASFRRRHAATAHQMPKHRADFTARLAPAEHRLLTIACASRVRPMAIPRRAASPPKQEHERIRLPRPA